MGKGDEGRLGVVQEAEVRGERSKGGGGNRRYMRIDTAPSNAHLQAPLAATLASSGVDGRKIARRSTPTYTRLAVCVFHQVRDRAAPHCAVPSSSPARATSVGSVCGIQLQHPAGLVWLGIAGMGLARYLRRGKHDVKLADSTGTSPLAIHHLRVAPSTVGTRRLPSAGRVLLEP